MSSLKIKNNGVWETIAAIEGKRGPNGIAVDSIEPIDQEIKVWIDPNGDPLSHFTSNEISIIDTGLYYSSTTLEGALQEAGYHIANKATKPTNEATATVGQILTANGDGTSTYVDFSGGGQLLGTATVKAISYNAQTIGENITIPATYNAMSVGDITILDGYTVTLEEGSVWKVV